MEQADYKEFNQIVSIGNYTDDDGDLLLRIKYNHKKMVAIINREMSIDIIQHLMSIYSIHKDEL